MIVDVMTEKLYKLQGIALEMFRDAYKRGKISAEQLRRILNQYAEDAAVNMWVYNLQDEKDFINCLNHAEPQYINDICQYRLKGEEYYIGCDTLSGVTTRRGMYSNVICLWSDIFRFMMMYPDLYSTKSGVEGAGLFDICFFDAANDLDNYVPNK